MHLDKQHHNEELPNDDDGRNYGFIAIWLNSAIRFAPTHLILVPLLALIIQLNLAVFFCDYDLIVPHLECQNITPSIFLWYFTVLES